mmetsp:Transcript_21509/g.42697  ORF Transcript_21509/g.42697 Transcript_21509/m.42697 type:complete len:94 (-) Transcript_21509:177-458(-)
MGGGPGRRMGAEMDARMTGSVFAEGDSAEGGGGGMCIGGKKGGSIIGGPVLMGEVPASTVCTWGCIMTGGGPNGPGDTERGAMGFAIGVWLCL